jgi:hypothetical protein
MTEEAVFHNQLQFLIDLDSKKAFLIISIIASVIT